MVDPIQPGVLYCAQLGQLDAAQEHLGKSYELGNAQQIKLMALDDDDLKPLWDSLFEAARFSVVRNDHWELLVVCFISLQFLRTIVV